MAWPASVADHRSSPSPAATPTARSAGPSTEPCGTITTRHDQALVSGCQVVAAGNTFERDGSTCRSRPLSDPSWAIHTTPAFGVAFQVEAMLGMNNGGWDGNRYRPTDRPAPTVTTTQAPALVTHRGAVIPFRRHTHPTDLAATGTNPDRPTDPRTRDLARARRHVRQEQRQRRRHRLPRHRRPVRHRHRGGHDLARHLDRQLPLRTPPRRRARRHRHLRRTPGPRQHRRHARSTSTTSGSAC